MRVKVIVLLAAVLFSFSAYSVETVPVDHYLMMPCINGGSGFIQNPSAYSLPYGNLSLALHNFTFKATYGFHEMLEGGIYFDFGGNSALVSILKSGAANLKFTPLREQESYVTLAAGIERFPFNVFEGFPGSDFNFYTAASRNQWGMNFTVGAKKNITNGQFDILNWKFMADISRVINDTVLVTAEYDGHDWNLSAKVSLNYNISMEVVLLSLNRMHEAGELGALIENHFVFGIVFLR